MLYPPPPPRRPAPLFPQMHDCAFSSKAFAPPRFCSSTGRKDVFFPCRSPSPLSIRSVSPDHLIAVSAGMVAGSVSGAPSPSSDLSCSACASPSKTTLPSPLSLVRAPLATLSGGGGRGKEGDGSSGGGIIQTSGGSSPSRQKKDPSSPSQSIAAAAAAAGRVTPRPNPSTTSRLSSHQGPGQPDSSPAAYGGGRRFSCPSPEQLSEQGRNNSSMNGGVRRIGSIEEFGWGPLRPAATGSPRRAISGISGGCPENSAAKRTRFV